MKIKLVISILFLLLATGLYYFGFCKWDMWTYGLCVLVTFGSILIFVKQEKRHTFLLKEIENNR